MNTQKTKRIVLLAILIALSSILSYFDTYICSLIPMGLIKYKLGFANIAIMLILYNYHFKEGILAVLIKSLLVGFLFGSSGIITFLLSLSGSLLSFIVMYIFYKVLKSEKYLVFIGIIGGFFHPVGQLLMALLIYGFQDFFASGAIMAPIMLIMGIITGALVGLITRQINKKITSKFN